MSHQTSWSDFPPIDRYNTSAIFTSVVIEMKEVGNVTLVVRALLTEEGFLKWLWMYGEITAQWEINQMISTYDGPTKIRNLVSEVFQDFFRTASKVLPVVSRRFSL